MHMPSLRWNLAIAFAIAAAAAPARQASANVAAPIQDPGRLTAPRYAMKSPLIVRDERLSFQCEEEDGRPVCAFEARYRVENPTAEPSGGRAAFYGLYAENVAIKVDGRAASAKLSPEEVAALDNDVMAAEGPSPSGSAWKTGGAPLAREGFDMSLPAGGRAEIVVTGRMRPGQTRYSRGYVYNPAEGRHLLLHAGDTEPRVFELDYLLSPIKTWAEVHRMEVSIRYPTSWSMNPSFYGQPNRSQAQWQERTEGDTIVKTTVTDGKATPEALGNVLELFITLPGASVEHGGPFVGVGGVVGDNDASGFRMRFGYEIASPYWLVESLTVDTDFTKRLVIAPNVEAALPHIVLIPILPSLSVGAGVPIQILPKVTVGARLLGTFQIWALGFAAAVDIFPALSPEEGRYQGSLMGRVSL
jgi:hypothetical protein